MRSLRQNLIDGGGIPGGDKSVQDPSGEETLFAPNYTINLDLTYRTSLLEVLDLMVRVDYQIIDDYSIDPDNDPIGKQDGHQIWNMRIALTDPGESWSVALIGKNLGDEYVKAFGTDVPLQEGTYFPQPVRPRITGIQFDLRF